MTRTSGQPRCVICSGAHLAASTHSEAELRDWATNAAASVRLELGTVEIEREPMSRAELAAANRAYFDALARELGQPLARLAEEAYLRSHEPEMGSGPLSIEVAFVHGEEE